MRGSDNEKGVTPVLNNGSGCSTVCTNIDKVTLTVLAGELQGEVCNKHSGVPRKRWLRLHPKEVPLLAVRSGLQDHRGGIVA
eukprot:4415538-Amphidinium_carterae.1